MHRTLAVAKCQIPWLWLIIGLALGLRLFFVLIIDPNPRISGGDTGYLLEIGKWLVTNTMPVSPAAGPVYLIFAGSLNVLLGQDGAVAFIRILNCFMGAGMVGCLYVIANRFFSRRVGLAAAFILAISPAFIIESGSVLTESLFLITLLAALAIYSTPTPKMARQIVFVGILLGIATLTRAVALLLPTALIIHLIYVHRLKSLRLVGLLLLSYALTVSTWTCYNLYRWQRFIIAAEGLAANVYIGTTNWCGPECVDKNAGISGSGDNEPKYVQGAISTITSDPLGYIRHRFTNLTESLLQPQNTVYFPGESIKEIAAKWWSEGHTLAGLSAVFSADAFAPKLALYIFHYGALIFGFLGLILSLRHFWERFPIYGIIGYFLGVHSILTANPRYLFPIEPFLIIFAMYAIIGFYNQLAARAKHNNEETVPETPSFS